MIKHNKLALTNNFYDVDNVNKIFLTIGGEAVIAFVSETATVLFSILSPDRDVYSTIRHVSRVKYSAFIKYLNKIIRVGHL